MKQLNRWIYAIVGVISLLMAGTIYAWSVMSKTIGASHPEWSAAQLSLTFTVVMAFFCIGSLVAGLLSKRIHPRIYMMGSAIFMLAGFFLASMTTDSPVMLYIGFGVCCGFGAGLAYNAVMGTICAWFPDKQGLISGILLMGFGLSSFIIGKVFAAIAPPDGSQEWCILYRIMAVVWFVVLLICSFFFVKPDANKNTAKVIEATALDVNASQMIRIPVFWLLYVWAILVSAAGLALIGQASGIASQVGPTVAAGTIATVVGLISILNGLGRIVYGAIFDKMGYRLTMILEMVCFLLTGFVLLFALKTGSFAAVVIGFMLGGFSYAGVTPIQSAVISDFFGRTHYSTNFSVIVTNLLIASFASTISGRLYDSTQSYNSTILMMLFVTALAFLMFIGIRRPKSKA